MAIPGTIISTIAAIEGRWENVPGEPTPLLLFGLPNMAQERTKYGLEIPKPSFPAFCFITDR